MENATERLVRYLNEALTVEQTLITGNKDITDKVHDPKIKEVFAAHTEQTRLQAAMLETRINELGGSKPGKILGFFGQMMTKFADIMHQPGDVMDEDTQLLIKAYGLEHFEAGMYESLAAYSTAIGDTQTATLARTLQAQELEMGQRVWALLTPTAARAVQGVDMTRGSM
jgi:ferritin-like metal-binding protein YciE